MSLHVRFDAVADREFLAAAEWYDAQRAGLGAEFIAAVDSLVADIAAAPEQWAVAHGETREAPLDRFSYAVYYRVRPGRVRVIGVVHTARDPAVWTERR